MGRIVNPIIEYYCSCDRMVKCRQVRKPTIWVFGLALCAVVKIDYATVAGTNTGTVCTEGSRDR